MKKALKISLISVFFIVAVATSSYSQQSWQYDSDKYVSFKEKIELSWEYEFDEIDYFEMDIEVVEIEKAELPNIIQLIKNKASKKLIQIENKYRKLIDFDKKYVKKEPKDKRIFIDTITPSRSGIICFYQVYAVVETKNKKFRVFKSEPAELSIMRLHGKY